MAGYSTSQIVKQIFVKHYAQVDLHHEQCDQTKLYQNLIELDSRKGVHRQTPTCPFIC